MVEALQDPVLGKLTWDDEMDWWIGELTLFPDHQIEVFIEFDEEEDSKDVVLSQAHEWITRLRKREPEYRAWTARQLLEGRWNKDEPMTVEDIEDLLRLVSVECSSDGTARVYWDDEDELFYGHGIFTQLNAEGKCVEVRMQ